MTERTTMEGPVDLPYGPFLTRTLPTLSRSFRVLNRIYVIPAVKSGLGPLHANPLTGSWMLLRTTGRRTARKREAALGYAILDGAVYCSAGFGPRTQWPRTSGSQWSSPWRTRRRSTRSSAIHGRTWTIPPRSPT